MIPVPPNALHHPPHQDRLGGHLAHPQHVPGRIRPTQYDIVQEQDGEGRAVPCRYTECGFDEDGARSSAVKLIIGVAVLAIEGGGGDIR